MKDDLPNPYASIQLHVFQFTCAIFDEEEMRRPDPRPITSATLVQFGQRCFVATAAHSIPDNPNQSMYLLGPDNRSVSGCFLDWGCRYDGAADIAFLEISKSTVEKLCKQALTLDLCSCDYEIREDDHVLIAGSPAESIPIQEGKLLVPNEHGAWAPIRYRDLSCAPYICCATWVVPASDWPRELRLRPRRDSHVLLRYDPRSITRVETGESSSEGPNGYSGGGVWLCGKIDARTANVKSMLNPDDVRLLGIPTEWDSDARLVKATRIKLWLDLVDDYYS